MIDKQHLLYVSLSHSSRSLQVSRCHMLRTWAANADSHQGLLSTSLRRRQLIFTHVTQPPGTRARVGAHQQVGLGHRNVTHEAVHQLRGHVVTSLPCARSLPRAHFPIDRSSRSPFKAKRVLATSDDRFERTRGPAKSKNIITVSAIDRNAHGSHVKS